MPYKIAMQDGKHCIMKEGEDTPISGGCHPTEADAKKHMAALEANVPDAKKDSEGEKMMLFSQNEVNYVTLSATAGKACANCRWFCAQDMDGDTDCHLVMDFPDAILPTGYCDRHEDKMPMQPAQPAPIPVVIVEPDDAGMDMEKAVKGFYPLAKVKALIESVAGLFTPAPKRSLLSGMTGFKDLGNGWWIGWFSNNFEDRQKEIFSKKAIDEYIERVNSGSVPMPELRFWHKGFSVHGQAKSIAGFGHFLVALGQYDNTEDAKAFQRYYAKHADELGMSHGFYYPDWALQDGVYHAFNTFEISVLPANRAANPYTSFMEVINMQEMNKEQQALFAEILGEERLKNLLAAAEAKGKELEVVDVKYKSTPIPPTDPALAEKVKTLETAQASFATKDEMKALTASIDGLKDFLKAAFGDAKPASGDKSTEIKPDDATHPYHALMASWLQEQGNKGAVAQKKSILDYMLDVNQQGGA